MAQIGGAWVSTSWVSTGGWADGTWGAGTGEPEPEAEVSSGGGGIMVRDRKRPRRPDRDIAYPSSNDRSRAFTPVIRDTTTNTPTAQDLPALLAAWMAFEDL